MRGSLDGDARQQPGTPPLDEVPPAGLHPIRLPPDAGYANEPRFDPEAAALAVTLQDLARSFAGPGGSPGAGGGVRSYSE
jgi:hypothetical protein